MDIRKPCADALEVAVEALQAQAEVDRMTEKMGRSTTDYMEMMELCKLAKVRALKLRETALSRAFPPVPAQGVKLA